MKVLILAGSPRKGGNTDILADEAARGARESGAQVEKVYLDDFRIRPIGEVGDVIGQRVDTRADDDFLAVFGRFTEADAVIFATPVYWQGVSAQTKCFIDRLSAYIKKPGYRIGGKAFAVITTFGAPDQGKWVTESIKPAVKFLGGTYAGDLAVCVTKKGEVRANAGAMKAAYELGRKLAGGTAGK